MSFWSSLNLKKKLLILLIISGLVPALIISLISLSLKSDSLTSRAFEHLEAVKNIKANQLQTELKNKRNELESIADQLSFQIERDGWQAARQYFHDSGDNVFPRQIERSGHYDLFMVDLTGYCFYTVAKEDDYQSNLLTGRYKDSGLGEAIRMVINTDAFYMTDFALFAPSDGVPAAFTAMPVKVEGKTVMIIAMQLSIEEIDAVMTERTGMGETGETYLVGQDMLMRSDSHFDPVNHSVIGSFSNPILGRVDTVASRAALMGQSDYGIITDYSGREVMSAYKSIKITDNLTWAIIAEIEVKEALQSVRQLQYMMASIGILTIIFIVILALYMAGMIARPIRMMAEGMTEVHKNGDLSIRIPVMSSDESGQACLAFNAMLEKQQAAIVEVHEVMAAVSSGNFSERVTLNLSGDFSILKDGTNQMADSLSCLVSDVQKSCIQLSSSSVNISAITKEQTASAKEQEATTCEIMATSKHIAQTSRELVDNMDEVARSVDETSVMAEHGHEELTRMSNAVEQMVEASQNISDKLGVLNEKANNINTVVTTINKIADQTNLLSVNAAIEADKAGEHGIGFSTVATEIRRLADQTAVATYDIENMVKDMQTAVSAGVMGMEKFSDEIFQGVDATQQVGSQLSLIVEKVQTLAPHFESVHKGMRSQTDGAEQIQEALSQLGETLCSLNDSMRMSNGVVEQLNDETERLQNSVAGFQVSNDRSN
ncbi:MAG: methyl-accepting chemotaxis protein [Endozoicomonadaceae bacterium]|nr:methyl-accepting chemotaxis protein [Endozoicomonadaceae bacterium]